MISTFKIGDLITVKPKEGLRVQEHPQIHGRFLPAEGKQLAWSTWVHDRVSDGSMLLCVSEPQKASSAPTRPAALASGKGDE